MAKTDPYFVSIFHETLEDVVKEYKIRPNLMDVFFLYCESFKIFFVSSSPLAPIGSMLLRLESLLVMEISKCTLPTTMSLEIVRPLGPI